MREIPLHVINCLICLLVVKEIQTARKEKKDILMRETYEERRKWVTQSKELGPTIEQVMASYPVFHTDVDQVCIHNVPIQIIPSKETNFEYEKRLPKFVHTSLSKLQPLDLGSRSEYIFNSQVFHVFKVRVYVYSSPSLFKTHQYSGVVRSLDM